MTIRTEVTLTFFCDYPDAGHDHIRGEGVSEFEDTTRKRARKQATDAGWLIAVRGLPDSDEVCYCPECVKRHSTAPATKESP